MSTRHRWLALSAAAIAITAAVCAWLALREPSLSRLLTHLPHARGIAVLHLADLRRAGLLDKIAGPPNREEPDYQQFVQATGFNYRTDLDLLLLSFSSTESLAILQGRFDWPKLEQYASQTGGACKDGLCRLPASTPQRHLSFLKLSTHTLAFASSPDPEAAFKLRAPVGTGPLPSIPTQPVWLLIPPPQLREFQSIPTAARLFTTALADTDQLTLTIGPHNNALTAAFDARCRTAAQATEIQKELAGATTMLARVLQQEKRPHDPRSLASILAQGSFSASGTQLTGRWPIDPAFFEAILSPQ